MNTSDIGKELFSSYWHLVGHVSEFDEEGKYFCFEVADSQIAVFNDGQSIVAFDNVCPHRGARIFPLGKGSRRAICPYHGWSFRAGKVIPSHAKSFVDCDLSEAALNTYFIEIYGPWVFVAQQPKMDIEEQLQGVSRHLTDIGQRITHLANYDSYVFECDWPLAVENALEPYHISMVHPSSLGSLRLSAGVDSFFDFASLWDASILCAKSDSNLQRVANLLAEDPLFEGYRFLYLFPFSMISSTYSISFSVQNFFPASDSKTFFDSRLYSSRLADAEKHSEVMNIFLESTMTINRRIFAEDHEICKKISSRTWNFEKLKFGAVSERKINHFRSLIAQNVQ